MTYQPSSAPPFHRAPRVGLWLALAAVAVSAPRLVLAFLEAEGIPVSDDVRAPLLALTGIATGLVLTGGAAYLVHVLAEVRHRRRLLAGIWLLILTSTTVLVTPVLVAGLGRLSLPQVLPTLELQWAWAAVAVLGVELVAGGAMLAHVTRRRQLASVEDLEEELLRVAAERNRLARQLEAFEAEPPMPGSPPEPFLEEREARFEGPGRQGPGEEVPPEVEASPGPTEEPEETVIPCRNGCGAYFSSKEAERGHLRACPLHSPPS